MNSRVPRGPFLTWLLAPALVAAAAYGWRAGDSSAAAAAPATQDISRVETRLSLIEQRFRSLELSISRLEQQSRLPTTTPGVATRGEDVSLLRAEVDALRRRLAEAECGLARVDERTLNAAAKQARQSSARGAGDPCRLNAETPVQLPSRP